MLVQPQIESAAEPVKMTLAPTTTLEHKQSSHFSTYRSLTCIDTRTQRRQRKFIRDLLNKETQNEKVGRLIVVEFADVQYIEFDKTGQRAIGAWVRHVDTGLVECLRPSNGGEIVLCAGVFESPRILHTSIERQISVVWNTVSTNQKHITKVTQVPVTGLKGTVWDPDVVDLLGSSLQDHLLVPLMFLTTKPWTNPVDNNRSSSSSSSSGHSSENGPSNGIHGWIYLDDQGCPCDLHSSQVIPRFDTIPLL